MTASDMVMTITRQVRSWPHASQSASEHAAARGADGFDRPGVGPLPFPRNFHESPKMDAERAASDGAIMTHNHRTHAYTDAVHVLIEAKNASGFLPPRRSSLAPPSSSAKRQRTATTLHPSIPVPDALIASLSSTALGESRSGPCCQTALSETSS